MVNTWKNIHKNETFGKKYNKSKNDIKQYHYEFFLIENIGNWWIYYDNYHKVYSVSLNHYWLSRHFKTKKTAKQFISKHYDYSIYDLKNENLS